MSRPEVIGVVAYDFSERVMGGSIRIIHLVQYLARLGYRVHVVTSTPQADQPQFPGVSVHHLPSIDRRFGGGIHSTRESSSIFLRPRGLRRLAALVQYLLPIERQFLWRSAVLRDGKKIFEESQISLLITTSSPYTALKLGNTLSAQLGVKHLADIRDDWSDRNRIDFSSKLAKWLRERSLNKQIAKADHVTVVSPLTKRRFASIGVEATLVRNGFREEDFRGIPLDQPVVRQDGVLLIRHLGWLGKFRSIAGLNDALAALAVASPGFRDAVLVEQVGLIEESELQLLQHPDLKDLFLVRSQVDHTTSIELQTQADVLLCIPGINIPAALTGKLFEYLRSRRPILLLAAHGSAAAELGRSVGLRWIAHPQDSTTIARYLLEMIELKRSGTLGTQVPASMVPQFSRDVSARQFAACVHGLLAASPFSIGLKTEEVVE